MAQTRSWTFPTPGVVILEYEVQGNAVGSGELYDNHFALDWQRR